MICSSVQMLARPAPRPAASGGWTALLLVQRALELLGLEQPLLEQQLAQRFSFSVAIMSQSPVQSQLASSHCRHPSSASLFSADGQVCHGTRSAGPAA